LPYQQCAAVFEQIAERLIPASSIWRQTQRHGERLQAYVEQERQQVSVERVVLPEVRYDHDRRKGVSLDGGMVNIRGEGWREMKVGAVFDIALKQERHPQTGELEAMPHGEAIAYTAVLGSLEAFTPALWALAVQHDVPTATWGAYIRLSPPGFSPLLRAASAPDAVSGVSRGRLSHWFWHRREWRQAIQAALDRYWYALEPPQRRLYADYSRCCSQQHLLRPLERRLTHELEMHPPVSKQF
jgi:hypothetical protein